MRVIAALLVPALLVLAGCGGTPTPAPAPSASSPASSPSATSSAPTPIDPGTYDEGYAAAQTDYKDPSIKEARHPQADRSDEWNQGYLDGWTAAFDADQPSVDPKQEKRNDAIRERVKKSKHIKAWVKNQSKKSALAEDFDAAEAAVNVCWDLSQGKSEDEAAEFFGDVYLDADAIAEWSPNPEATIEGFSQSFVELVAFSDICGR